MKAITIKNLSLQFDSFDNDADPLTEVHEVLDIVNNVLASSPYDCCPQIMGGMNITSADINVEEVVDDYEDDCEDFEEDPEED